MYNCGFKRENIHALGELETVYMLRMSMHCHILKTSSIHLQGNCQGIMRYASDIIQHQYAGNPLHQTVDQYLTVDCDRESRHKRTNLKHVALFHTYVKCSSYNSDLESSIK